MELHLHWVQRSIFNMKNKIIYITGFMGSGKSTIGPILANTLGWDFADLDKVIEKEQSNSITKIFEQRGEEYFRKLESETLKKFSNTSKLVLALGGGTLIREENLRIIKETGFLIYLKSSPEILTKRLYFKRDRPILNLNKEEISEAELLIKIKDLHSKRNKYYEQSDYIINTEAKPLGRIIDQIVKEVNKIHHIENHT